MPRLMLDMRSASTGDPGSAWILGPTQSRLIGTGADDGGFHLTYRPGQLTQDYDVLIFFGQTTPSELLPLN
jgi:erythromycin esterase-like protein